MEKVIELFRNSGFTALLSMVLTLLIKGLLDARSEKRKEKERFFYEIFPKRMRLYEEILQATDFIPKFPEQLNFNSLEYTVE